MNTYADKTKDNKTSSVAVNSKMQSSVGAVFQFVDNCPEAATQRKLQEMVSNSSQVSRLKSSQDVIQHNLQARKTTQLQAIDDNSFDKQQPIQKKNNNTGLPDNLKSGIESLSGYSFDDVKVHYNSNKPEELKAHAYAQGSDIYLGHGQEKHLPHEAWHVVQQKQRRVSPTMQLNGGVNVNNDAGLEREADIMGNKANSIQKKSQTNVRSDTFHSNTVQKIELKNDVVVSSFDPSKIVTEENAIITAAATKDSFDGGHAMMFLEILGEDNLAKTYLIHLGTPDGEAIAVEIKQLQTEYQPSGFSSLFSSRTIEGELRLPAKSQSYVIGRQKGFTAMALARQIGANENIKYSVTGNKFWNLNPFSSITYMNCSDFVEKILTSVGVSTSGGIASRPAAVAEEDARTNEQIYAAGRQ